MAALVKKLLHLCITVPELNEGIRFYQGVLGFESVFETDNGSADGRLLGLDTTEVGLKARHILAAGSAQDGQSTQINLVEFADRNSGVDEDQRGQTDQIGLSRLALLVDDVEQAFSDVQSYPGVEVVCPPNDIVINDSGTVSTSRWFSFRDPFGVFITVTAHPADS